MCGVTASSSNPDSEGGLGSTLYDLYLFQAEDGIRDYKVTGVQTCALPISRRCRSDVVESWLGAKGRRRNDESENVCRAQCGPARVRGYGARASAGAYRETRDGALCDVVQSIRAADFRSGGGAAAFFPVQKIH